MEQNPDPTLASMIDRKQIRQKKSTQQYLNLFGGKKFNRQKRKYAKRKSGYLL
jgi:hypothetical protein